MGVYRDIRRRSTGEVPTLKLADVCPAETSKLAGSVNEGELLDSVTVAPPQGAGAASVTCPVNETPPVTLERSRKRPTDSRSAVRSGSRSR